MPRTRPWEVSDEFWALVEPLIPKKERREGKTYKRKPGAGRKSAEPRTVFSAIVYVLRTGIQWNALPKEKFGVCSSTVHRNFQEWSRADLFLQLWQKGLSEYDDMEGIAWTWQSADSSSIEAPLALESVGPNPTDRGKKRKQTTRTSRRAWRPAITYRHRSQSA